MDSFLFLSLKKEKSLVAHRLSTSPKWIGFSSSIRAQSLSKASHLELLSRKGHYAHMWQMQAGGFLPETDRKK